MKKQELIHLHGLLAEVSNQYEEWSGETPDLEEYESLGIRPTSIHKSKTDHKAAVFAMTEGITAEMREETEDRTAVAPTAD
ncbi:metal-binding protein [Halobacteriales archaeon QS_8_69_26]|nr:MAG: metal-binding protein [Halobacteriales archaeon QS_8_69_26]